MDFDYFLNLISRIEKANLGGTASHDKMIPPERKNTSPGDIQKARPKKAAVLALFYPDQNNLTNFLLILRAAYDGTHASQIGFPGGKFEDTDIDLVRTALRETEEEVGVPVKNISICKKMTDTYIPPSNFIVSTFMGITESRPRFRTNHEVEDLIEVELSDLLNDSTLKVQRMSTSYMRDIDVPCFRLNNNTVWGATAMMLSEIKDLIKENLH